MTEPALPRVLVVACGALAQELLDITRANRLDHVTVECLPAWYHNEPSRIPEAVRARVRAARDDYDQILVGYADCGTGGRLDAVCEEEGVERIPGAHCYEFFAGASHFAALHEADPGTFYVTDFLVRHFDRLVISGLGLDRHPELLPDYFGNYNRLVYLAQTDNPDLVERGRRAAERLGLAFDLQRTGYGDLEPVMVSLGRAP